MRIAHQNAQQRTVVGFCWPPCLQDNSLKEANDTMQSSYRSLKTWKVMEFKYFSFQAWKVMEFNCWLWKGMENYSVCGTEIIAGVD